MAAARRVAGGGRAGSPSAPSPRQAAAEWEAAGRDPGELYRGARLAAALDWADADGGEAGLNRLEREFLEESRTAFAREASGNGARTGACAACSPSLSLLLVAALAAGAIALTRAGTARSQATAAIAQRLGAQALVEPRLDRSLLLAREGVDLDDSVATRSNLLAALLRSPAALAVLHGGGARVLDDALSRDGRTLALRGDDGSVAFFDTADAPRDRAALHGQRADQLLRRDRASRARARFQPRGRTLAVGDSDGHSRAGLPRRLAHPRPRASLTSPRTR